MARSESAPLKVEDPAETGAKATIRNLLGKLDEENPKIGTLAIPTQAIPALRALLFAPSPSAVSTVDNFRKNAAGIIKQAQATPPQQSNANASTAPQQADSPVASLKADKASLYRGRTVGVRNTIQVRDEVTSLLPRRAEFVTLFLNFMREYEISEPDLKAATRTADRKLTTTSQTLKYLAENIHYGFDAQTFATLTSFSTSLQSLEGNGFIAHLKQAMQQRDEVNGKIRAKIPAATEQKLATACAAMMAETEQKRQSGEIGEKEKSAPLPSRTWRK